MLIKATMRLLARRPRIQIQAPRDVVAGHDFEAAVVVEARTEVRLRTLEIALIGVENGAIGAGQPTVSRHTKVTYHQRPLAEGALAAGRHVYRCRLCLPAEVPPTCRGISGGMRYTLVARAALPWWPAVKDTREIHVYGPSLPETPRPLLFASAGQGADGLYLEGSLASNVLVCGRQLSGALAFGNIALSRPRRVLLSLVAQEAVRGERSSGFRHARMEARRLQDELPLKQLSEGETIPFYLSVPVDLTPSHSGHHWQLRWFFEVRVQRQWKRDLCLRVPIRVTEAASSVGMAPHGAPSVGSERLIALLKKVGTECGYSAADTRLCASVGGCEIVVTRGTSDPHSMLVGMIRYPSLNLVLRLHSGKPSAEPARLLLPAARRGLWLSARDRLQARSLLAPLGQTLASFDDVSMDDHRLRVARRGLRLEERTLRLFCEQLLHLARTFDEARLGLRPPRLFEPLQPEWQYLANQLCGQLDLGLMCIDGTLQDRRVQVCTVWSARGKPVATRILAGSVLPIDRQHCFSARADGDRSLYQTVARKVRRLPEGVRALVLELCEGARRMQIAPSHLAVEVGAPLSDSTWALERMRMLVSLAVGLRPCCGPYR